MSSLFTKSMRAAGQKAALVGWPAPGWPPPTDYVGRVGSVTVTSDTVLGTAAAWGCVNLLARSVARLPLFTYRTIDERSKQIDKRHPLYPILHDAPNRDMTAFSWRSAGEGHLATWGNHYAEIERNANDQVIALHPRLPSRWRIDFEGGRKVYWYTQPDTGREVKLPAEKVFHIPAFSPDGIRGYAPVTLHRQGFALGQTAVEYGTRVLQNDARPGIAIMHPRTLTEPAILRIQNDYLEEHTGPENASKPVFLEEGMSIKEYGFPPEDAQYLDTRKFQREETCRIFLIPPSFDDNATEEMAIKFVVHSLAPYLIMWEQEIKRQLIIEDDVFAEHAIEGLLRGSTLARYRSYAIGRTNGWLSVNQILGWENLNPIGPEGDTLLKPLNMQPLGGSEGSPSRNPSPSTGNPASPGGAPPLVDTEPMNVRTPSLNGRTEVRV